MTCDKKIIWSYKWLDLGFCTFQSYVVDILRKWSFQLKWVFSHTMETGENCQIGQKWHALFATNFDTG